MIESFGIIFLSILLEALPFVILGSIISSLIELFVSKDWIEQKMKHAGIKYYLLAGLMGMVFPVCECAIVPIMRRLVKKGVPVGVALTFMLATPIVNPVVLLSTFYAFPNDFKMVILRGVLGFIGAVFIGWIMQGLVNKNPLKSQPLQTSCACGHDHGHNHNHGEGECCGHDHDHKIGKKHVLREVLEHTSSEVVDVGRFLIFGALIAASMQILVPRSVFLSVSKQPIISILIMMVLAFVLSLCSEADAFIAATFKNVFPTSAITAFLIFGPMIDIKNTMMLLGSFKTKFVLKLILVIFAICLGLSAALILIPGLG